MESLFYHVDILRQMYLFPLLHDLQLMLPGGNRIIWMIYSRTCFLEWICTHTYPAQPLKTAGEEVDNLSVDHLLIEVWNSHSGELNPVSYDTWRSHYSF